MLFWGIRYLHAQQPPAAGQQAYGYQASYNTHDWNRLYHYPYVWYPQNYYADGYMKSRNDLYHRYPQEMPSLFTIDHGKIIIQNLVGIIRAIIFNLMFSNVAKPVRETFSYMVDATLLLVEIHCSIRSKIASRQYTQTGVSGMGACAAIFCLFSGSSYSMAHACKAIGL